MGICNRRTGRFSARSILTAFGYADGAVLARTLGGWQVISWALTLASPDHRSGDAA